MEENKILSAEEILDSHIGDYSRKVSDSEEFILDAMEEYAAQFKQQSAGVWVKASERLPDKDIRKMYYGKTTRGRADIFQWDDMVQFFRPMIHEADNIDLWLDESQQSQPQSSLTDEDMVYLPIAKGETFDAGAVCMGEENVIWLKKMKLSELKLP